MGVWEIIIGAIVLLLSVVMIIVIILQEGHDAGLGTITGGADSFAKRGKAKTADAMFAKITKFVAVGFFVFVVVLNAISYFGGKNSPKSEATITGDTSVVSETSSETEVSQTEETSAATSEASKETSAVTSETSKETSATTSETSTEASATVSETAESSAAA